MSRDEVEAQMSVDRSLHENLFGDDQAQDLQTDRDAMNARVEAQEPSMDDSNMCEQSQMEDRDKLQGLGNQSRTRRQMEMIQL